MKVFGIGFTYEGSPNPDRLSHFINRSIVCVGYTRERSEPLYKLFASVSYGDIIFAKKYPPNLVIHAAGVVMDLDMCEADGQLTRNVRWRWANEPVTLPKLNDHYNNFRTGTLYEELSPIVIQRVLDLFHGEGDTK